MLPESLGSRLQRLRLMTPTDKRHAVRAALNVVRDTYGDAAVQALTLAADALDDERVAAGFDPVADTILSHLAGQIRGA